MKTNKKNKYNSRIKSRTHTHKKEKIKTGWIILGILVLIAFLLAIIKVPYEVSYTEREAYDTTEYYYEQTNNLGCDNSYGCSCLHYSWFGLGSCDSCNCRKERTITKYRDIGKIRTEYCSLLSKIIGKC